MAVIMDGRALSKKIFNSLAEEISRSKKKLRLAAVLVGRDPASLVFLKYKEKACQKVGADFKLYSFPESISQDELAEEIKSISADSNNSGVIIQLPLPKNIEAQKILDVVPVGKDVDALASGAKLRPPVLQGIIELFKEYKIEIKGKQVAVLGQGKLVGQPAALWAKDQGAEVTVIDSATSNASEITKKADILICGTGRPGIVKGDMVKEGAIIIDAGTAEQGQGLLGDVDFSSVALKAGFITPVPGGVGPMTIAGVIKNLVILNEK
jgi:methylenetetrahydrofolate dehydrogenase (NADP+)/methenyltetrahydrofolate cyclohydrolase